MLLEEFTHFITIPCCLVVLTDQEGLRKRHKENDQRPGNPTHISSSSQFIQYHDLMIPICTLNEELFD